MVITHELTMDFNRRGVTPVVDAVQGDTARTVAIKLTNGGKSWSVPADASVAIRFKKPDGTGGIYDTMPDGSQAYSISGNAVNVRLAPQMTSVPGCVFAQAELHEGENSLATFSFIVNIQPDPSVGAITSQDYYNLSRYVALEVGRAVNEGKITNINVKLTPNFANSIQECTETEKVYVLPDGYIYAYMLGGAVAEFTNKAGGITYGKRLSSSGALKDSAGAAVTDYIPVKRGDVIRIKGLDVKTEFLPDGTNSPSICVYTDTAGGSASAIYPKTNGPCFVEADGITTYTAFMTGSTTPAQTGTFEEGTQYYIRICGIPVSGEEIIVTINEEITYTAAGAVWKNTGHAFIPADYEDRIIGLETATAQNTGKINALSEQLNSEKTETVPEYWADAVTAAAGKVKALQDEDGRNVVNFLWFSDLHYSTGDPYTKNIGNLCAVMMDKCSIPFTLMSGDTMSAAVVDSEATLLHYLDGAAELLSPIGADRLIQLRGNHDDVWGKNASASYVNKVAPGKIWNRINRRQAIGGNHVFGGNGSYFYVDNKAQKVRFICLNSHYYDGAGIINGTVKNMSMAFGNEQLNWLTQTAFAIEDGWKVILSVHVPPTDYYLGEISDGTAFRSILTANAGKILAVFSGHVHRDAAYTDVFPFPIVTITCAANSTYDSNEAARTAGTATETALDIVSVNKVTGSIKTTRLGVGSDRSI